MMIYLLLVLVILLTLLSIFFTRDILSPPSILCCSYLLAVVCTIIYSSMTDWEIEIHGYTVMLISAALVCFIFFFLLTVFAKRNHIIRTGPIENLDAERILGTFTILLIVDFFIAALFVFFFFKQVGLADTISSFNNHMNTIKMTNYYATELNRILPAWVTGLSKYTRALAYVAIYVLADLVILKKGKYSFCRKVLLLECVISIILYTPIVILSTGRWNLIVLLCAGLIMIYIVYIKKSGGTVSFDAGIYFKILFYVSCVCILFVSLSQFVGRLQNRTIFEDVVMHFGGSIQNLDLFLENPIPESDIFGKETFYSLHRLLYQLGIDKSFYTIHLEFRSKDGINMGNVYTGIRECYYDFGFWGVVVLMSFLGCFFGRMYRKVMSRESKRIDINVIWYSIALSLIFFHSFSESFYRSYISLDYLLLYIIILMIILSIDKINIKLSRR